MKLKCPSCQENLIKKNGYTQSGKQNYRCLCCCRQFVENPSQKIISEEIKSLVKKALLERVSPRGFVEFLMSVCPWLLGLIDTLVQELPQDLNAEVVDEGDEIEVAILQADELWSYVGSKKTSSGFGL